MMLIVLIVGLLLIVPVGRGFLFTVDERELAVVLRFKKPVRTHTEPGLKFKIPFVDEVKRLPRTYQFWSGEGANLLPSVITKDTKQIEVTPWAVWRISDLPGDPERFLAVLRTVEKAESRLATEFVRGAMRAEIRKKYLAEVVRKSDRPLPLTFQVETEVPEIPKQTTHKEAENPDQPPGRREETDDEEATRQHPEPLSPQEAASAEETAIGEGMLVEPLTEGQEKRIVKREGVGREQVVQAIKDSVESDLHEGARGIELIDVGIARIDFAATVRDAAFERLIADMESIAEEYRSLGEREKTEILARTQAEVDEIEGEGKGESNRIRGEVEAEIIKKYAEAIRETGEFYDFVRTLEAYQEAIGPNTRLVLTTESEMFKLLKAIPPAPPPSSGEGSTEENGSEDTAAKTTPGDETPGDESSP
jgi:membrane protease subunit HflC